MLNDDPDFTPNGTVAADNTCLMDIVDQHRYRYYALDARSCTEDFEGGYLSVAAYVYPRNTIYNGTWGLLVNTGGKLPSAINSSGSDDGDNDNDDGTTLTDIVGMYLLLCTSWHIWHLCANPCKLRTKHTLSVALITVCWNSLQSTHLIQAEM